MSDRQKKPCTRCKIAKPMSEFYKNKSFKDGHDHYCRLCRLAFCHARQEKPKQIPETKTCRRCGINHPNREFFRKAYNRDGLMHDCKKCWDAHVRSLPSFNPEQRRPRFHRSKLKRKFGLDYGIYLQMLKDQDHLCAICGGPETSKAYGTLSVDHDHVTGQIRGLLCSRCNQGIGLLQEDIGILKSAIRYLKRKRP